MCILIQILSCTYAGKGGGEGGFGAKTQISALYWSFHSSDGAANVSVKGLMLLGRRPQLEATHPPPLISKQTYTKERKKEREERKEREEEKEEKKNTRSA